MQQLVLTTSKPGMMGAVTDPLCDTKKYGGEVQQAILLGSRAYLHGKLESIAGYDIPIFMKGDMAQLDEPLEKQDILCVINDKEYICQAELQTEGDAGAYYLILKP